MTLKVAVSACLLGVPCRYDGKSKPSSSVQEFLDTHDCEVTKICPEVMGGLPIPHPAHEIKRFRDDRTGEDLLRVVDKEGNDHTAEFLKGAEVACDRAVNNGCTHALLKAKSPSCGVGLVYDGSFTKTLVPGNGVAASLMEEKGITVATKNDFKEVFCGKDCEG